MDAENDTMAEKPKAPKPVRYRRLKIIALWTWAVVCVIELVLIAVVLYYGIGAINS